MRLRGILLDGTLFDMPKNALLSCDRPASLPPAVIHV